MIAAMLLVVPLVAVAPQVCPRGLRTGEIVPRLVLMSRLNRKMWDPAAGIAERAALSPRDLVMPLARAGFPTRVAAAENWSPARPMCRAAALHSDPMRQVAVSLVRPMRRVAAQPVPRDYRSPAPVDSSHQAQPVVPGVANRKLRQVQQRSYPSWIFRRVVPASL